MSGWVPGSLLTGPRRTFRGLVTIVLLYDQVMRGEYQRATELRLQMDNYGITPKGQQDRRWARPVEEKPAAAVRQIRPRKLKAS